MIRVIYVPLDERACNYHFPQRLAEMTDNIELLVPPYEKMGMLKAPADYEYIWKWLFDNASQCDYAILSVDTLVYGNIVNSRIHNRSCDECSETLDNFRKLKQINPNIRIHAFNLVARVAGYDNAHEDPEYWETCGRDIWRYTCLMDKIERKQAEPSELDEFNALKDKIPQEYLKDFIDRREVDQFTNLYCVDLVKENIFDILTIPKDDTAEFGYAAIDQKAIAKKVTENRLMDRVLVYPGADEVGCILFTRIFNLVKNYTPRVYVRYSSVLGPQIIPKYEDRPLYESIKSQITSLGGILEESAASSDCMLAVNSPGKYMIESSEQFQKDLTFSSHINMHEILKYISYYRSAYKKAVGIAEVSVCNGCENEFMDCALLSGVLEKIQAVGGWNTAQNTIGVVLSKIVIASYYNCFINNYDKYRLMEETKVRDIVCDWLYQSNVLFKFILENGQRVNPYHLEACYDETVAYFEDGLRKMISEKFNGTYKGADIVLKNLYFNWDGVFYIDFNIELKGIKADVY
jgi:hypothetical protein